MKLHKVKLAHYRCFESIEINLEPDINVLVGVNGAGKTTLLDAISVALFDVVAANGGHGERQRDKQGVSLRSSDLQLEPGTDPISGRKDFVHISTTALTPSPYPQLIEWQNIIKYTPPSDFSYSNKNSNDVRQVYDYFNQLWLDIKNVPRALNPLPVVAYYRADRRLRGMPSLGDISKVKLERSGAYLGALNAGSDFTSLCQWFYIREHSELRERVKNNHFQFPDLRAVRDSVSRMIDDVEEVYYLDNTLVVRRADQGEPPQVLLLEQLSDGYRNLLGIVMDFARRLAQANPSHPEPLLGEGILLIDEIELHLHPAWQQKVLPSLKACFPNTQIIVSTHSPAVVSTVRRENLLILAGQKITRLGSDVGTYGAEASKIMAEVFGTLEIPVTIDTNEKIRRYLKLIEAENDQSEEALALRRELIENLGTSDPLFTRADLRIRQIKVLKGRK